MRVLSGRGEARDGEERTGVGSGAPGGLEAIVRPASSSPTTPIGNGLDAQGQQIEEGVARAAQSEFLLLVGQDEDGGFARDAAGAAGEVLVQDEVAPDGDPEVGELVDDRNRRRVSSFMAVREAILVAIEPAAVKRPTSG